MTSTTPASTRRTDSPTMLTVTAGRETLGWYLSKRKQEYAENREEILAQQKRIRDANSPIRDRKCENPDCHRMVS